MIRMERVDRPMDRFLRPIWVVLYYAFLTLFATLALLVNLLALLTAPFPGSAWKANFFQGVIRALSMACFGLFHVTGIMHVECVGFDKLEKRPGVQKPVLIANHPCLLDVFLFYLKLPRLTCIYKASLKKTLIRAELGKETGFISNADPRKMISDGAETVASGKQMVIFPEATRTVDGLINPFKLGAAAIARMGGATMQTVLIYTDSNVLSKDQSCFAIPQLPIRVRMEVGEVFDPAAYEKSQEFNRVLEQYFNDRLSAGPATFHGSKVNVGHSS